MDNKVVDKDTAVCRHCKRQLCYSSMTTNLRAHLLAYQAIEAPQASGAAQRSKATKTVCTFGGQ